MKRVGIILIIIVIVIIALKANVFTGKPVLPPAQLSFQSDSPNLPPDTRIKVITDVKTNKIGFAQVTVTFDPKQIKLNQEITINPSFQTVIKKSSVEEANNSGRIEITVGLKPGDTSPTGIFEIAELPMTAAIEDTNQKSILSFDLSQSQLVDMSTSPLQLTKTDTVLTLN